MKTYCFLAAFPSVVLFLVSVSKAETQDAQSLDNVQILMILVMHVGQLEIV